MEAIRTAGQSVEDSPSETTEHETKHETAEAEFCRNCRNANKAKPSHCSGCAAALRNGPAPNQLRQREKLTVGEQCFRVTDVFRQSAQCQPYFVSDLEDGNSYFLKKYFATPLSEKRFDNEVEALRLLSEKKEFVGRVPKFVTAEFPYIIMGRIDGSTLKDVASLFHEVSKARKFVLELLKLLKDIHEAGLVHRDIKPANIMVCGVKPVLIDFGCVYDQGKDDNSLTKADEEVGNRWMTLPEDSTSGKLKSHRLACSDVTRACGVLFWLLAEIIPGVQLNFINVGGRIHEQEEHLPKPLEKLRIDDSSWTLFDKAFHLGQMDRIQTAANAIEVLGGITEFALTSKNQVLINYIRKIVDANLQKQMDLRANWRQDGAWSSKKCKDKKQLMFAVTQFKSAAKISVFSGKSTYVTSDTDGPDDVKFSDESIDELCRWFAQNLSIIE